MVAWIIGAIIAIIILIACIRDEYFFDNIFWRIFFGTLVAILIGIIVAFLISALGACIMSVCADTEWVETNQVEVIAVADNVGVEGQIYLYRGYVEDALSYYYIAETEFGLKTFSANADDSYINYTSKQPYMIIYEEKYTNEFLSRMFGVDNTGAQRYVFYLPEGSVITDSYEIDLE
jgi:uncharacterized membrane protein YraQ (UPF0718 family)